MESSKNHRNRLCAPAELVLDGKHWLGPLACLSKSPICIPAVTFALQSRSPKDRLSLELALDSLSRQRNGEHVNADLTISAAGTDLVQDPQSFELQIAGLQERIFQIRAQGNLPPDTYASKLVVHSEQEEPLFIPVRVRVSSHWIWPLLLMVAGLMTLGCVKLLAEVAEANNQLASILAEQQAFHEMIEVETPAEELGALVGTADAEFAEALNALQKPRSRGLLDRRPATAQIHLSNAIKQVDLLHNHSQSMAAIDIAELDELWVSFQTAHKTFGEQLASNEQSLVGAPGDWPKALATSLQTQRQAFHDAPWREIQFRIEPQVRKTHVVLATGNHKRAQELAVATKRWVRRAATEIENWMAVLQSMHMDASRLHQAYAKLEQLPSNDEIKQKLSAAVETLTQDPSMMGFQKAHSLILAAQVDQTRLESIDVQQQVRLALDKADASISMDYMEAAIDKGVSKQEIISLYEQHVKRLNDVELSAQLIDVFAQAKLALKAGNKKALVAHVSAIHQAVFEYGDQVTALAFESATTPYNNALETELVQLLTETQNQLRLIDPNPRGVPLQKELDELWQDYGQLPKTERMSNLVTLLNRTRAVGDQTFAISLSLQNLTTEARSSIAEHSGVADAIAFAKRVTSEPWPIEVSVTSDPDQIAVGRDIVFEVRNLAPDAPSAEIITIDFGDGSTEQLTVEALRRKNTVTHRYQEPRRFVLHVVSGNHDKNAGPTAQGNTTLIVAPSQIQAANSFADGFFHLQFFIALGIGVFVQLWRSFGERPFGSQGADYIGAFAWGVGIDAGVRWLAGFAEQLTAFL